MLIRCFTARLLRAFNTLMHFVVLWRQHHSWSWIPFLKSISEQLEFLRSFFLFFFLIQMKLWEFTLQRLHDWAMWPQILWCCWCHCNSDFITSWWALQSMSPPCLGDILQDLCFFHSHKFLRLVLPSILFSFLRSNIECVINSLSCLCP